jgi:hypothetical protein
VLGGTVVEVVGLDDGAVVVGTGWVDGDGDADSVGDGPKGLPPAMPSAVTATIPRITVPQTSPVAV